MVNHAGSKNSGGNPTQLVGGLHKADLYRTEAFGVGAQHQQIEHHAGAKP